MWQYERSSTGIRRSPASLNCPYFVAQSPTSLELLDDSIELLILFPPHWSARSTSEIDQTPRYPSTKIPKILPGAYARPPFSVSFRHPLRLTVTHPLAALALTSRVKHRTPNPRIHLDPTEHHQPPPQLILPSHPPSHFGDPVEVDVEVPEGHQDGDWFLDRSEAVEWPFAVDWEAGESRQGGYRETSRRAGMQSRSERVMDQEE